MQFSKKERILIILLMAAVFLLGGFKLLITPALDAMTLASKAYDEATVQKQQIETNIANADRVIAENVDLEKEAEKASEKFFPNLESDRLQVFFDGIAKTAGISYQAFSFSPKEYVEFPEFSTAYATGDYSAKEFANIIRGYNNQETTDEYISPETNAAPQETEPSEINKFFEKSEVTVQFSATYAQALSFIGALENSNRYAFISSMSFNTKGTDGTIAFTAVIYCFGTVKIFDTDTLIPDTLTGNTGKANPFN